ncbi:thiamin pyrophosphokinase 1 isoform X1 [Plutella xylostella]|uniref:thiamin pyrophosphokinase 1 isoform X1 n=1 Tax=Plutella xylostella TaxID=51655 RepID=UPI0020330BAB|nr:thiamin pyrophosphokinase 1 isoform X1 [Plutella xylostella]
MNTCKLLNKNAVRTLKRFLYLQQNMCGSSCAATRCWKWDIPERFSNRNFLSTNYAIMVLNRPVCQDKVFIENLWNNAIVRITVDGGTSKWDNYVRNLPHEMQTNMKRPDLVTGDFDSITEDTLEKYKKQGLRPAPFADQPSVIVHTPDQNHTDFTKALMELYTYCQSNELLLDHVIVLGQASGRLDQILGNIQTLFLAKEQSLLGHSTGLYLLSDDALSWLLNPGDHVIHVPEEIRNHKRVWCSLVPIGETCDSVTTSGLKWNLDNSTLKFGCLVSTSNTFSGAEKVTVKCSHTILWSMKIPGILM